jgi:hypothetical protein
MAFPSYATGTVSVTAGGTVVTGVGTLWTSTNVQPGDEILIAGREVVVMDFTDATHLVINPWQGTTVSGVAYKVIQSSLFRGRLTQTMAEVSEIVATMTTDGFYVFVPSVATVPNPSYGKEGQFALQATTGKLWLKEGGVWTFVGVNKGFGLPVPWSGATAYKAYDTASLNGSTYVCILAHTNQAPPNATYWSLLAAKGDAATIAIGSVTTLAGGATATVANTGTSGAAVLAFGIPQGKGYGGTSTTAQTLSLGLQGFATQSGLAYQNGARVRATATADASKWEEGLCTYSGSTLNITVDKFNGTGTFSSWNFNVVGQPGAGDLSSANALSELSGVAATARSNLGLGNAAVANVGTGAGTVAAGNDSRIVGALQAANNFNDVPDKALALAILGSLFTPQGRLTLTSNTPVMTSNVANSNNVYYTPYNGNIVPVYNGGVFIPQIMYSEMTQTLNDTTKSPAAATVNTNYDMFVWNDAGTLRCTRGPAWTDALNRSAGTALVKVSGIWVNGTVITNGPLQYRGTYVGTIRTNSFGGVDWNTGTSAAGGGAAVLGVWNAYNRLDFAVDVNDSGSWTTNAGPAGAAYLLDYLATGAGSNNRISAVTGLAEDAVDVSLSLYVSVTGAYGGFGIGRNSTSAYDKAASCAPFAGTIGVRYLYKPNIGFNFWQAFQFADGTAGVTMLGATNMTFIATLKM